MTSNTRIMTMWTIRDAAQVSVEGRGDPATVERFERVLDRLIRARARHLTGNLARLEGPDTAVVELLAAVCHRLWARRGCLHVLGLGDRLASNAEVTAFPEVFGTVPHPREPTSPTAQAPGPAQLSRRGPKAAAAQPLA